LSSPLSPFFMGASRPGEAAFTQKHNLSPNSPAAQIKDNRHEFSSRVSGMPPAPHT